MTCLICCMILPLGLVLFFPMGNDGAARERAHERERNTHMHTHTYTHHRAIANKVHLSIRANKRLKIPCCCIPHRLSFLAITLFHTRTHVKIHRPTHICRCKDTPYNCAWVCVYIHMHTYIPSSVPCDHPSTARARVLTHMHRHKYSTAHSHKHTQIEM